MKIIATVSFLLFALPLFSQKKDTTKTTYNSYSSEVLLHTTYGYIDGVRLDSISALYATFSLQSAKGVTFDYGQDWEDKRRYRITDSTGKPLLFRDKSLPFIFHFFHFNHWDFIGSYATSGTEYGNTAYPVLKKW